MKLFKRLIEIIRNSHTFHVEGTYCRTKVGTFGTIDNLPNETKIYIASKGNFLTGKHNVVIDAPKDINSLSRRLPDVARYAKRCLEKKMLVRISVDGSPLERLDTEQLADLTSGYIPELGNVKEVVEV